MAVDIQGTTVDGRYSVSNKIQSGFYGSTWLAKDLTDSKDVCLKTFFSEGSSQKKELLVLKEMASGNFCHDNLCSVFAVALHKAPIMTRMGTILTHSSYVVFEYCSGTDLFNFLVTGPFEKIHRVSSFPEPLAQYYFTQALLAVAYLHERGVFHRDIKPENCVLDGHFNLKLTDFGTNKIMSMSEDPSQILRTATKGIGTDSYRAPEVNGVNGYDPSLADVWSLGVTLFFMVGIDGMVAKVQSLDQYTRQMIAPLGIVFPFPLHCSKLDCYMNSSQLLKAPCNEQFWSEWSSLRANFSPNLLDLFNRVFHLNPNNRTTLRELAHHPWVSMATSLRPEDIVKQMQERCPSSVSPSQGASPRVLSTKVLGGVDQATLRTTLSSQGDEVSDYLTDSELWPYSDSLYRLEATQINILEASDIEEFIVDLTFCRQLLMAIVTQPQVHEHRSISSGQVCAPWIVSYLSAVGFLPQGSLLYLPIDHLNLPLVSAAATILDGLENAVFKSAVNVNSVEEEEMSEEPRIGSLPNMDTLMQTPAFSISNDSGHSTLHSSQPEGSCDTQSRSHGMAYLRRYSSDPHVHVLPMETTFEPSSISPQDESSQDSMAWTQYTGGSLSAQSSQEECPEDFITPGSHDYSQYHRLLRLSTMISTHEAKQYKAAGLFCKLSGLLTSYGLYQVVLHQQLALYCRGSTACFSARMVIVDQSTGEVGISSWCFHGNEEWLAILARISSDMTVTIG